MSQQALAELAVPWIRSLRPYVAGKPVAEIEREYGIRACLRLDANENPLGVSPRARAVMLQSIDRVADYPDGGASELKDRLARYHGLSSDCITVGNGSNEVLVLLAETFLTAGCEAVCSQFCFAIFPLMIQGAGGQARIAAANPASHAMPFGHDLDAMLERVTPATRIVFIANPNNPTGTWLSGPPLRRFLEALPRTTLAVVDEAYCEYASEHGCPDTSLWLAEFPNLVVVRTFSKAYGLAGLRVGYCLSHPEVAQLLNRARQPFNVSSLAQAAAVAALEDEAHLRRTVAVNRAGLSQLRVGVAQLDVDAFPSAGNFLMVDTHRPADAMYRGLLKHGVMVRPLHDYCLTTHLRVTVGTEEQNQRFLTALTLALG